MRERMALPHGLLDLVYGKVYFTMCNPTEVYMCTCSKNEEQGREGSTLFRVNGVPYYCTCRLNLIDGVWKLKDYSQLYIRRADRWDKDYPTDAAAAKIRGIILESWPAHIARNPDYSRIAQTAYLNNEICDAEEKVAKAAEELAGLRNQLALLEARFDIEQMAG